MNKTFKPNNDGIELSKFIRLLSKFKVGIFLSLIAPIIFVIVYQSIMPPINFTATTKVQSMKATEINKYKFLNQAIFLNEKFKEKFSDEYRSSFSSFNGVTEITESSLLSLFFEVLDDRKLFEEGIRKYGLVDINKYENKELYDIAVTNLAAKVKINTPERMEVIFKKPFEHGIIKFVYNDEDKWRKVLSHVSETANLAVKQILQNQFNTYVSLNEIYKENQQMIFELKTLNMIDDYEDEMRDRLLYLEEQVKIARQLNIAKVGPSSLMGNQPSALGYIMNDKLYYLRGYEAIEKEMELIKNRSSEQKKSFIPDLLEIKQQTREIVQEKNSAYINSTYSESPLGSGATFFAGTIKITTTEFEKNSKDLVIIYAISIGVILGLIYIFVANQLMSLNTVRKN